MQQGFHTPGAGLRPGAADLKAHSAGPATVPWGHSGTASENMLIVPVMIYEQFKLSPMVHNFILRVYVFPLNQTYDKSTQVCINMREYAYIYMKYA